MRRYGWLVAGLLLIVGVLAAILSRPEEEPAPVSLPPIAVAAPRVVGAWIPSGPLEVELVVSVTERGQPVSGAEVIVSGKESVLTDQRGLVTLNLPPGAVQVSATAHGITTRSAATISPLIGSTRIELSLDARGVIAVTVIDEKTKRPLQDALVELHLSAEDPRHVIAALKTDVQGKAKVEGLVPMEYLLSVTRAGYRNESCLFAKVGETPEIELVPHEARSGRVLLPNGKPAVGATVVSMQNGWEESSTATTAADGTFTLPFMSRDGELCAQLGELVVEASIDVASTTGMILAPPRKFEGTVIDEEGAPLAGVRVRTSDGALEVIAITDANGQFKINGLCSPYTYATFEREGFITEGSGLSEEEPTEVTLASPRAVRGVVVDDENRPVSGAVVKLNDPELLTISDAQGRFGFEGVKGTVTLTATEGHRGGFVDATVERGQLVEVTLSVGPELFDVPVEVLMDNKPAEGTWDISAKRIGGREWQGKTSWHAKGRVMDVIYRTSFSLPLGTFQVNAKSEDGHGETEFRVTGGPSQEPLRIHAVENPPPPPRPTRPLWVRVFNARGEPVADAGIDCEQSLGRTDESGRGACPIFADVNVMPSSVRSRVGGAIAVAHPKDPNEEVVLRLSEAMSIRGSIVGELQAPGFISVNSKEEQTSMPFTPPEFVIPELPTVRTIVCVWSENTERGCAVAEPVPSGELQVTIPIGARTQVSFAVNDARGLPVAEPILYVDRHRAHPPVDGGVVMLALSPGQHLLIVNVEGGPERYESIVAVEPGRAQHLGRIELR